MKRQRIGAAARRRVKAGGKLAVGRDSETLEGWKRVKEVVAERAKGRCEYHGSHSGQDFNHVVKRSDGGPDHEDNVIFLCRESHDRTDAPYKRGRLIIEALGGGHFVCRIVRKEDKWAEEERWRQ